jgi:hypothetical protein
LGSSAADGGGGGFFGSGVVTDDERVAGGSGGGAGGPFFGSGGATAPFFGSDGASRSQTSSRSKSAEAGGGVLFTVPVSMSRKLGVESLVSSSTLNCPDGGRSLSKRISAGSSRPSFSALRLAFCRWRTYVPFSISRSVRFQYVM